MFEEVVEKYKDGKVCKTTLTVAAYIHGYDFWWNIDGSLGGYKKLSDKFEV